VLYAALCHGSEVYRRAALALARNDRLATASDPLATSAADDDAPAVTKTASLEAIYDNNDNVHSTTFDPRGKLDQSSPQGVPRREVEAAVRAVLAEEPLIAKVEYVSVASRDGMIEVADDGDIDPKQGAVLSLAVVTAAGARLIDNVTLLPWGTTSEDNSSSSSSSSRTIDNGSGSSTSGSSPKSVALTPKPVRRKPLTAMDINRLHKNGAKLRMVTAYSAPMAAAVDASGAEMALVGDSLGMVELGMTTTQPVTLDQVRRVAVLWCGIQPPLYLGFGGSEGDYRRAFVYCTRLPSFCQNCS